MASKVQKHGHKNVTIQDKTIMSQKIMTTPRNQSRSAHSRSTIPNCGNTTRTQVGRRICNGHMPEADSLTMVTRHQSRGNILLTSKSGKQNRLNSELREDIRVENELLNRNFEQEDGEGSDTQSKIMEKETRGPTYMQTVWGRPANLPPIHVEYNDLGQPIGGEHSKLCHFLGSLARNGKYCPIDVMNWHKMPQDKKLQMLDVVKLRFYVPIIAEKWILTSIGHKWRNWKHSLKTKHWHDVPVELLLDDTDDRVLKDQWVNLLNHWSTEEAKQASERNTVARKKKLMNQRTGKTSFAQIKARLTKEQGRCPTRVELFNSCFVSSNGNSDEAVLSKYTAMLERSDELPESSEDVIAPDDVFAQIMGKDKPGHVRMFGQGICSSDVWSETPRTASNRLLMQYQAKIAELEALLLAQQKSPAPQVNTRQTTPTSTLSTQQKSTAPQADIRQTTVTSYSLSPHATTTPPLQVGTYVTLESLCSDKIVAEGCIHSIDPNTTVGGQKIGNNWCVVNVKVIIDPEEQLIRPHNNFQKLSQTLGEMIAWPCSMVTPTDC